MKKAWILALSFGAITMVACNEKTTTAETASTSETTTSTTVATTTDTEVNYTNQADQVSNQMATDLNLDPETQSKARDIYHDRAIRLSQVEQKYYGSTSNSAGTDTTGMYAEINSINTETDAEFKGILTPEQYRSYEANRMNYNKFKFESGDVEMKVDGDESKLKAGDDLKIKTDGDESKMEAGDLKMKTDGDESKIKTSDSKTKTSPTESKYKSGDSKIKVETR